MDFLRDFLNDGPKRTKARDEWIEENVIPFIPPEMREWLTLGDYINPVSDIRRAGESAQTVFNPDRSAYERIGAAGNMAVDMASVLAPAAGAKYAGDATKGIVDALAMASMPADDAAQRFVASEAGSIGKRAPEIERGDEILSLLSSGRGADVTDDMLDMGDPVLNARLNEYLFDNYDLPMDEASRMARAGEMLDTDAFHATRSTENFSQFQPGWRGSNYFAATPQRAQSGALGGAQDASGLAQPNNSPASVATIPVRLDGNKVASLRPPKDAWDTLPENAFIHNVDDLANKVGGGYWWDVYDEIEVRPGVYEYVKKPYPAQEYTGEVGDWRSSRQMLPGWSEGSDKPALSRAAKSGQAGFLVNDEAGSSIVAGPDMPVRSRFARFDPRLAHLRNLSAATIPLGVSLGLAPEDEEELRNYLNQ